MSEAAVRAFAAWDLATFRAIYGSFRSVPADWLFALLSTSAVGGYHVAPALYLSVRGRFRPEGFRYLLAVILSSTSPLFKTYVARMRPSTMAWVREQETFYSGAFPSGHATLAFAVGLTWFFSLRTRPEWRRRRWVFVLWPIGAAVSRVYRGVHWPSDVLGGALLGTMIAGLIHLALPMPGDEEDQPPVNAPSLR